MYLFNSLNLSELKGYGVGHFDHPGTPVQSSGALAIEIYYLLEGNGSDIVYDAISRPESYLSVLNKFFVSIVFVALLMLGVFAYKVSGDILIGLLIQLSLFISAESFYASIDVSPDNLMIGICLCIAGLLVFYLYKLGGVRKQPLIFIIIFAFLCGLGIATKFNFVPLLIIPLIIIREWKAKLIFGLITIISFFIFILPALSDFGLMMNWVGKLIVRNGIYGSGESTIINPSTFTENLMKIFSQNYLLGIIWGISLITLVLSSIMKTDHRHVSRHLLLALFLAMSLGIIIVAKHFHPYTQKYLIPSIVLSMITLLTSLHVLSGLFKFNLKSILASVIAFIVLWNIFTVISIKNILQHQNSESQRIEKFLRENYNGKFIISDIESASEPASLDFATTYSGSRKDDYEHILTRILPSPLYYSTWTNQIYSISDSISVREEINSGKEIVAQLSKFTSIDNFLEELKKESGTQNFSSKKVFENGNGEKIYFIQIDN